MTSQRENTLNNLENKILNFKENAHVKIDLKNYLKTVYIFLN